MNLFLLTLISVCFVHTIHATLPHLKGVKSFASKAAVTLADHPSYRNNLRASETDHLEELKKKKECQTLKSGQSAILSKYSKMCYEMGAAAGVKDPHLMYLVNSSENTASVGAEPIGTKQCKAITVNQTKLYSYSQGAAYLILGHEWAHELERFSVKPKFSSRKSSYIKEQEIEIGCDSTSALTRNCKHCTREFASYFLHRHNTAAHIVKVPGIEPREMNMPCVTLMPDKRLNAAIELASCVSRGLQRTHPIDLERFLRLCKISRNQFNSCNLHRQKTKTK